MYIKILAQDQYFISSIMKGDKCPIEDSPLGLDSTFCRAHAGLMDVLERVAETGLQQFPSSLSHAINRNPKIYEFIRGRLRLIYFHGSGNTIVVCTEIVIKKSQKADPQVISKAIEAHDNYYRALEEGALIVIGGNGEN